MIIIIGEEILKVNRVDFGLDLPVNLKKRMQRERYPHDGP
jgi:hypothetical protein